MRYGSVCSGIEAATVAWHPMGWTPAFLSEIEKFPRSALEHHYPDVPLHGDFTTIGADEYGSIDLLVGGTPCQSFSIAGLRGGLDDDRGNLALEFLRLADRKKPRWIVWENVPGVYSALSHDAPDPCPPDIDLGGDDGPEDGEEIVVEDEYDSDEDHAFSCFMAGLSELGYGIAYRTLDAQYVRVDGFTRAVPQRRRRVFVVGYLGDWRPAAAVLLERESLCGNSAPRREKGESVAPTITGGPPFSRTGNERVECKAIIHSAPITGALDAHFGDKMGLENQHINQGAPMFVVHDTQDPDVLSDLAHPMGRNSGQENVVAFAQNTRDEVRLINGDGQIAGALAAENGMKQQTYISEPTTLAIRGRKDGHNLEFRTDGTANAILTPNGGRAGMGVGAIHYDMAVRRLTPRECERLQGFPDDYTKIPYRGKPADQCPDGPRYKALGNSMAVPVMRWIGERIQQVEQLSHFATENDS